jgi:hypothetical protein
MEPADSTATSRGSKRRFGTQAAREFLESSRIAESLSNNEDIDRLINALLSVQFGNEEDDPLLVAAPLDQLGNVCLILYHERILSSYI